MKWFGLGAAALLCVASQAQNLTGKWVGIASRYDNGREVTVAINQGADGKITGYIIDRASESIVDGKVDGNNITLEVERAGRGGNPPTRVAYSGVLEGDKLKLTVPQFGGGRGPGGPGRGPAPGTATAPACSCMSSAPAATAPAVPLPCASRR